MTRPARHFALVSVTALAAALVLTSASDADARDLYVAPDGNDDDDGTEAAPWETIGQAATSAAAGDTVYIRAGTYSERLIPQQSGTSAEPVVFTSQPGESVTLDGAGLPGQGVVYISGVEHVQVSGLEIINGNEAGIWLIDSSHITLSGNRTYNTVSSGIIVSEFGTNDHIYIHDNEVELACNDGGQECISISQCDVFEVIGNHVHDGGPGTNGGEGIDAKFGSSNGIVAYNYVHHLSRQGLYADAWSVATHDIEYYGNVVHDCQFGLGAASEQGGELYNISFHNNLVYDTPGPGMYILMSAGPLYDIYFVNNTVHNTGYDWGSGLWLNGPEAQNVIVRNNIFSSMTGEPFFVQEVPQSWTVDFNLAETPQSGYADGFITGAPGYVDASAADFHLEPDSLGVDSGSADTVFSTSQGDLERNARVQDGDCNGSAEIDLGAFELASPCAGGAGGTTGSAGADGSGGLDAVGGSGGAAGADGASGSAGSQASGGSALGSGGGTSGSAGSFGTGGVDSAGGSSALGGADSGGTTGSGGELTGVGGGAAGGVSALGGATGSGGEATGGDGAQTSGGAPATGGTEQVASGGSSAASSAGSSTGGDETDPNASDSSDQDGGCGCRVAGGHSRRPGAWWLALMALTAAARRRRR